MANRDSQGHGKPSPQELVKDLLLAALKPGDMLLYSSNGAFGWGIKFKTASEFTHVALYIGDGKQREFREFIGAQECPLNINNLVLIKRPYGAWDRAKSDQLWDQIKDWKYDHVGLFWSFYARKVGRKNEKMFCSEYYASDYAVAVGSPLLFAEEIDADSVTPGNCAQSPSCWRVWPSKRTKYVNQSELG